MKISLQSEDGEKKLLLSRGVIDLGLSRPIPVYASCPGILLLVSLFTLKCHSLDDKLYGQLYAASENPQPRTFTCLCRLSSR